MKKIANVKDLKPGSSLDFENEGKKGILVKTKDSKLVAYSSVCPHEGGAIVWDKEINKLICECHLSIFNTNDGTVYKFSTAIDKMGHLTPIKIKIDDKKDIYPA